MITGPGWRKRPGGDRRATFVDLKLRRGETDVSARTSQTYDVLGDAALRARRYLESLDDRSVAPDPAAVTALARLDEPLPAAGTSAELVLKLLDEAVSPATMAMAGPRFFGFVIGGALPVTVASNWLATAWDQNAALQMATPGVAAVEQVALRWLLEILGLPSQSAGGFVTGGTVANFTALAAARHRVLANAGWEVEEQGLAGAPPVTVMVGEEAHSTLFKSLSLLGFGRATLKRIPVDEQGRLRVDQLPAIHGPTIVCTQLGNINTGAFDPVGEICERLKGSGAWVHVDGAFGLWARATRRLASQVAGVEKADSWATDAHKWLNVPYDSGLAFVRDAAALRAAMSITAAYLPSDSGRRSPSDYTPELSRRARGVDVWAALRCLGREGVEAMIDRDCRHARRFAEGLAAGGFRILNDVPLNQVLVSFGTPEVTQRVIAKVQQDGSCWCGVTVWQGQTAMRISVSSWATSDEDVEMSLIAILRAADEVGAQVS
jgi:glutamate/tyrosine decarboxylase-like PLP-dependent enzyme